MTKNLRQKFKYLENEKSFQGETKNIFRAFSCKKLPLRPEIGLLKLKSAILFIDQKKTFQKL